MIDFHLKRSETLEVAAAFGPYEFCITQGTSLTQEHPFVAALFRCKLEMAIPWSLGIVCGEGQTKSLREGAGRNFS